MGSNIRRAAGFDGIVIAGLLWLGLAGASPAAAVTGYSIFDGDLVAIDLSTGAFEIVGELDPNVIYALAADPAGELFAVGQVFATYKLYRVDRATGALTPVGDLGDFLEVTGLTFDAAGTLWMSGEDALYTVDPSTAEITLVGVPDRQLLAFAARGDELFGLSVSGFTPELVAIDPATADTTLVAALPELSAGGLEIVLAAMDFKAHGSLWVFAAVVPPILPPGLPQTLFRINDLDDPHPTQIFGIDGPPLFIGLAVAPGPFNQVVEIPTLDPFGGVVLAALLLSIGLAAIRRRR